MGQSEILSTIQSTLFKDSEFKDLLCVRPDTKLAIFRDKYCITKYNSAETVDKTVKCRVVISWSKYVPLNNPEVLMRTLSFDIFVHQDYINNASSNALIRRQDLIQKKIKKLFHNQRVAGFKLKCSGLNDALSGNQEYVKAFILFDVKHIF